MTNARKRVEAVIARVQEEGRRREENKTMKSYFFKSDGKKITVQADGLLVATVLAKTKVFGLPVRFIGAETEEGERWCESCESDECPCPSPDGCHGEREFYRDQFDSQRGHYQTFERCDLCRDADL